MVAADLMNDYNGKGGTFNGLLIGFWGVLSTQQCMGEHDEGGYKLQSALRIVKSMSLILLGKISLRHSHKKVRF